MANSLSNTEIHEIVRRVVNNTLDKDILDEAEPGNPQPTSKTETKPENTPDKRTVALGTDHGGVDLKEILKQTLIDQGYAVIDVGTHTKESVDYPDIALSVAELVASGKAWRGVVIDGAGIGSCMAANKVPGIRAALCYDHATASNSREHNDANVLTLGAGLIGTNLAKQILTTWLTTPFGGGRHARRVNKIIEIEHKYLKDGKAP